MTASIILDMTAGAKRVAETDPHGLTLTLIAVTTVFTALVVLYFIYSLIGKISQRGTTPAKPKASRTKGRKGSLETADEGTVAAIAMALDAELGGGTNAAIAMALHLYLSDAVHDTGSGVITIAPRSSAWEDKSHTLRKTPRK